MAEKLKTPKSINWDDTPEAMLQRHYIITDVYEKINELVDAVNELQGHIKFLDERIKTKNFMVDIDKTNPVSQQIDPYAEQRKWIGHLVEYGNADDGFKYGILTNVEPIYDAYPFEIDNGRDATADCWLPHESIIYKE